MDCAPRWWWLLGLRSFIDTLLSLLSSSMPSNVLIQMAIFHRSLLKKKILGAVWTKIKQRILFELGHLPRCSPYPEAAQDDRIGRHLQLAILDQRASAGSNSSKAGFKPLRQGTRDILLGGVPRIQDPHSTDFPISHHLRSVGPFPWNSQQHPPWQYYQCQHWRNEPTDYPSLPESSGICH